MVPGFGFSARDFIAAISLTVKISKALRKTGGASAECRLLVQDLQILQTILELLQDLRPASGSLSHVNAIRGVAITCLLPLRDFAEKIDESYSSIASASSSHPFLRRSGKKIQWSVFAAKDVSKFRSLIVAKVASVSLLLGIINSESLSRIESQNKEATKSLLADAAAHRKSLEEGLSKIAKSHHDALSNEIYEARIDIQDQLMRVEQKTKARDEDLLCKVDQHRQEFESLSCRVTEMQGDTVFNMRNVVGLCFGAVAGILVSKISQMLSSSDQERVYREYEKIPGLVDPATKPFGTCWDHETVMISEQQHEARWRARVLSRPKRRPVRE